jgi:hypothetical protein
MSALPEPHTTPASFSRYFLVAAGVALVVLTVAGLLAQRAALRDGYLWRETLSHAGVVAGEPGAIGAEAGGEESLSPVRDGRAGVDNP